MESKTFTWQDYSVFGGLLVGSTLIGVYYAWKDRNAESSEEFLSLKKAKFGLLPVCISLIASYISAITILSFPGEIYTHGTQFWLSCFGICSSVIIADFFFLPVVYNMEASSINEYYFLRFNSVALRSLCSVVAIFGTMFYLGAVLFGPSLAISSVTDLNLWASVVTIGIVCTFYTTIGGLKAVIWTDFIQMIIMTTGLFVVVIKISTDLGGLPTVFRIANEGGRIDFFKMKPNPFNPMPCFWDSLFQPIVTWTSALVVSQTGIQRICGMPTLKKARLLTWLNVPGVFLLTSLACLSGTAIFARYADCDPLSTGAIKKPDQLMPYYVMNAFHHLPGLPGLFVACVFSASLSTLSSGLNSTAAITWSDFIEKRVKVNVKMQILITKAIAVAYGLIMIGLAFLSSNVSSILQAAGMLAGPLNGALFAAMTMGVLCPFANRKGVFCGMICSVIFGFWTGIGGALVERPQAFLPARTDGCVFSNDTFVTANITEPEDFQLPSGIKIMQYFSPYVVAVFSYLICFTVSIIISLATGGARGERVLRSLVHPGLLRFADKIQKKQRYPYFFPEYVDKEVSSKDVQLKDLNDQITEDISKTRF